jgi:hypothetical protein
MPRKVSAYSGYPSIEPSATPSALAAEHVSPFMPQRVGTNSRQSCSTD